MRDILIDLQEQTAGIFKTQTTCMLNSHVYFFEFVQHLEAMCSNTLKIFQTTPVAVLRDARSDKRAELLRQTLVLNHMLNELCCIFHNGVEVSQVISRRCKRPHILVYVCTCFLFLLFALLVT